MANLIHQYADSNFRGDNPTPRGVSDNRDMVIEFTVNGDGTVNTGDTDVWKLAYLKGGTSVEVIALQLDAEIDSHVSPTVTIDVGYAYPDTALTDDDNYFVNASTIGQAATGGTATSSAAPKILEGNAFIEVSFQAGFATAVTTPVNGRLILRVGPGNSQ